MDQRFQRNLRQRSRIGRVPRLLSTISRLPRGWRFHGCGTNTRSDPPRHRLPPTRAARETRSRGFFFGGRSIDDKPRNDTWPRRLAVSATVVTMATILILASAPFLVEGAAVNANPGPGLVAATAVPPAFFSAPAKL